MNRSIVFFPIGAILFSVLAMAYPALLTPLKFTIVPLLGVVMFGMGITLTPKDFLEVIRRPTLVALGLILQFLLMPLIAFLLAKTLDLSLPLLAGLVLVGACPGGTASNVICYLAKGDVALSITLTSVATLLAVFMTPFLTWAYIGQAIDVPVINMLISIFKIIIIPVGLGVLINQVFASKIRPLKRYFPLISMLAIILIIGIIVALNQEQLSQIVLSAITAVVLHNLFGLTGGYWIAKFLGYPKTVCKALAIEVGMQNSGLGVALAVKYFPASAALPGALFSIWHNLSGALLATIWSKDNKLNTEDNSRNQA